MAIDVNIPSQVKTYADLAAFPATGTLKTIFIAEDTNKTYRWTGTAYVEVSATAASTWGAIGGTLSNQTDLQNALNAKQDTLVSATNIKTINGTTLLGSGDLVVGGGGVTIGTTAITSGTVGRVLFQGTGNVVSQSADFFWDNTNVRLGIGTSSPTTSLMMQQNGGGFIRMIRNLSTTEFTLGITNVRLGAGSAGGVFTANNYEFRDSAGTAAFLNINNGNVLINTITDAGFKLDVNGTARVSGLITATQNNIHATHVGANIKGLYIVNNADSVVRAGLQFNGSTAFVELVGRYNNGDAFFRQDGGNGNISFLRSSVEFGRIFGATGNWGINTTTDAGFKLDVNGTARVSSTLTVSGSTVFTKDATYTLESGIFNNDGYIQAYKTSDTSATNIRFLTGNSEKLRLLANGNIIIQTAGTFTDIASAKLQINSTTQGFLPPRMTTTQKNAIATPATGLQIFDTTLNRPCFYDGTTWITL